jgi:hypothetical protein
MIHKTHKTNMHQYKKGSSFNKGGNSGRLWIWEQLCTCWWSRMYFLWSNIYNTPFSWSCSFTKVMNKFANTLAHTQTLFATPSMIFHKPNKQTKYITVNIYIKCKHVKGSMNLTNISVKGNYYFVHKIMINWLNSS